MQVHYYLDKLSKFGHTFWYVVACCTIGSKGVTAGNFRRSVLCLWQDLPRISQSSDQFSAASRQYGPLRVGRGICRGVRSHGCSTAARRGLRPPSVQRGDDEAWICVAGQVFGFADDTAFPAPTVQGPIGEVLEEHADRLLGRLDPLFGLLAFAGNGGQQARALGQTEEVIDLVGFAFEISRLL